jgi:ABC-type Zn uptake system ZnuABC Zn-binding protein ZnuA
VVAVESFLADIARNVAGETLEIDSLIPLGTDPHGFQLTPADAARVAGCNLFIVNGAGLESFLDNILDSIAREVHVIEASAGLPSRTPLEGEEVHQSETGSAEGDGRHHHEDGDPHFWLDPTLTVKYVENIRDGLSSADPANASAYAANAAAYIESLGELDTWIAQQVAQIPPTRRLLVTNHESLGYFADRYGFTVVGTIMPSVSTNAAPSAQQLARLVATIRETGVPAVFLETGSDPRLAEQLASETGIKVITTLYTHSLTTADGPAPTYIDMMKANTLGIVGALR